MNLQDCISGFAPRKVLSQTTPDANVSSEPPETCQQSDWMLGASHRTAHSRLAHAECRGGTDTKHAQDAYVLCARRVVCCRLLRKAPQCPVCESTRLQLQRQTP